MYRRDNLIKKPFIYSYSNLAFFLIVINFVVFFMTAITPGLMVRLAMNPTIVLNANAYWQFVTYMFTHGSFSHIFFNMLGIFFFGFPLEKRIGSKEFLLFYFVCGICAGIFSFFFYISTGQMRVFLVGASGAVYAVLFAYAVFYPNSTIYIMGLIPIRATWLVILYTGIEIYSQIGRPGSGVAHLTHLAGFAFAYLYIWIRLGINPADVFFRRR